MRKKSIDRFLAVFMTFLFFLHVQDASAQQDSARFTFPSFSFQIRVVDFFRFNDFQGASVSFKYHFTNKSALRVGVGLSTDKYQTDYFVDDAEADTLFSQSDDDGSRYYFRLYTQYLIYPNIHNEIKMYFGAGPSFTWSRRLSDKTYWNRDSAKVMPRYKHDYSTKSIALDFVFGAEWFFKKNMSLLLDYGFTIGYSEADRKETNYYNYDPPLTQTAKGSSSFIRTGQVKIGLSIYL